VLYCSVGYRSSMAAEQLAKLGYTDVQNLEGSLFAWANAGHPLEGGDRVHPYDAKWGELLDPRLRAPLGR
jgi:3-mercaptopyruvate sulfurtransferase SseA